MGWKSEKSAGGGGEEIVDSGTFTICECRRNWGSFLFIGFYYGDVFWKIEGCCLLRGRDGVWCRRPPPCSRVVQSRDLWARAPNPALVPVPASRARAPLSVGPRRRRPLVSPRPPPPCASPQLQNHRQQYNTMPGTTRCSLPDDVKKR